MFSSLRNFHPLRVAASAGLKGALPKVLVGAALLGGGASLLSAGNAQAGPVFCDPVGSPSGRSWTEGDKTISNIICSGGTPVLSGDGVAPDNAFLFFDQAGVTWDFATLFSPLQIGQGSISYTLSITGPNSFARVELDSGCDDVGGGTCNVIKDVFYTALGTRGTGDVTLSSVAGEESFAAISGKTIYVLDSWIPADGGALREVENAYTQTVPGPLPLLGAGMAFGFSRKLRSRIKARAQA